MMKGVKIAPPSYLAHQSLMQDSERQHKSGMAHMFNNLIMRNAAGMTLVEVCIAMALAAMLIGGLYAVGIKARQYAEHNRLANEARMLAKERMEELISYGANNLAKPTCTLMDTDTNFSSLGYRIVRQPQVVWHAANGTVASATNAAYAEILVQVSYDSPLTKTQRTESFSMIVEK